MPLLTVCALSCLVLATGAAIAFFCLWRRAERSYKPLRYHSKTAQPPIRLIPMAERPLVEELDWNRPATRRYSAAYRLPNPDDAPLDIRL